MHWWFDNIFDYIAYRGSSIAFNRVDQYLYNYVNMMFRR